MSLNGPDPPAPPDRLRAMTFNVRVDTAVDGGDAWPHRKDAAASVIRLHEPGIVGCQEPLAGQLAHLQEALPAYEWVSRGRGVGEREDEHVPIGYRRDRFELLEHATLWLSETPAEPGSVGWDGHHPRIATWARLADDATGTEFVHLNTHLDHRGERARECGAELIAERLDAIAPDVPAVVTGDLNCTPGSSPYERLTRRFDDAREISAHPHHGPTDTYHEFTGDPERRIDYVLVDGFGVRQYATLADRWDDRYPSDHFPVLAELVVEDR